MRLITGVILVAALATTAQADTITHKRARVSIDVPEDWKSQTNGDQITLMDQHENVAVTFVVVDAGAVKTALKAAGRELEKRITKLTFGKPEDVTINTMSGVMATGDGRLNGTDIDLLLMVLDTPSDDKDLLIIALGEDAKLAKHKDEVMYVFQHLRPKK